MSDYNVQAEIKDIVITAGDTVNISSNVYKYNLTTQAWDLYDMTGMQLDIDITDRKGNIIESYSSAGGTPEITISTSAFNIFSLVPFLNMGHYLFDIQLTNGSEILTIRKGWWIVLKQITDAPSTPIATTTSNYRIIDVGGSLVVQRTTDGVNWTTVITLYTP